MYWRKAFLSTRIDLCCKPSFKCSSYVPKMSIDELHSHSFVIRLSFVSFSLISVWPELASLPERNLATCTPPWLRPSTFPSTLFTRGKSVMSHNWLTNAESCLAYNAASEFHHIPPVSSETGYISTRLIRYSTGSFRATISTSTATSKPGAIPINVPRYNPFPSTGTVHVPGTIPDPEPPRQTCTADAGLAN